MNTSVDLRTLGPRVGDLAPPFRLPALQGGTVELDEVLERHRAALVFHRGSRCSHCTENLAELSAAYRSFLGQGIELLAVGNEPPRRGLELMMRTWLAFPMLVDLKSEVVRRYNLVRKRASLTRWLLDIRRLYVVSTVVLINRDRRISWIGRLDCRLGQVDPHRMLGALRSVPDRLVGGPSPRTVPSVPR